MSGSSPTPAEQHLGDRLAALVDGELKHDARDRVLAHLATCPKCKAEADAQRRLKDVFAHTAPPPPSEGLLARLQGLPAGPSDGDDGRDGPFGGGRMTEAVFGALSPSAGRTGGPRSETFGYVPGGAHAAVLPGGSSGFRIHEVGRQEAERSPWRGRRFAFAAASAVSFAAIALGGSLPLDSSVQANPRGGGAGNTVTPLRASAGSGTTGGGTSSTSAPGSVRSTEYERRRAGGNGLARSEDRPIGLSAPVMGAATAAPDPALAVPAVVNSLFTAPSLIRPTGSAFQLASAPGIQASATPAPTHLIAPTQPAQSLTPRR
ncbi:zf-HC2 domain-containing protein [Streptomyces sp. NPDC006475]|uniref:anti-sigma factor family protein n=1 Tax=Streptomyces sp. NPDC006475 TaxID=3155719 RepID=UPI0033B94827